MTIFKIASDGITWGYDASTAETAVRDVAELGYSAYEVIGPIIEQYQQQYGESLGALLERYNLPLCGVYCPVRFHNPTHAVPDIVPEVMRWVQQARDLGATTVILQAGSREGRPYTHATQWEGMGSVFTGIARRAADLGMITAIHPHTGTLIETRAEIDAILAAVDPQLVGFAPDTGQIAKGGADAIATLRDYKERIWHVHLKDYAGGRETGYAGYEALGCGVLDIPAVFQILEAVHFEGWVTVELDGTPKAPRPPREAAAISKRYLEQLLGERAGW